MLRLIIPLLWLVWAGVWFYTSGDVKPELRRESPGARAAHLFPLILAAFLLADRRLPLGLLDLRFVPHRFWIFLLALAMVAAGIGFSIRARLWIGRNWSASVTVKADHELITNGPYALVRHPIYSGMLLALAGTALARGEWRGILAVAIAFAGMWFKLKREERFMTETFGDAYRNYMAKTAALIPFLL